MGTMKVWVLLIYMSGVQQGGPTVVDNIASQAECERLRAAVHKLGRVVNDSTVCLEAVKVAR